MNDYVVLRKEMNYVTPQQFGAIGDGVNDDTNAIYSALKSGKNVYLGNGVYKVTNAYFTVTSGISVIGDGAKIIGTLSKTESTCDGVFSIGSDTVIKGIDFEVDYTDGISYFIEHIWIRGDSKNITIENCKFVCNYGDNFIAIRAYNKGISDIHIKNCYFQNLNAIQVNVSGINSAENIWVEGCYLNNVIGGIGLNNPTDDVIRSSAKNFYVVNNTIVIHPEYTSTAFGIDLAGTSNVVISGNTIIPGANSAYSQCIHCEDNCADIRVVDNCFYTNEQFKNNVFYGWFLSISDTENVVISGNTFGNFVSEAQKVKGIFIGSYNEPANGNMSTSNVICNNNYFDGMLIGIEIAISAGSNIYNNNFRNCNRCITDMMSKGGNRISGNKAVSCITFFLTEVIDNDVVKNKCINVDTIVKKGKNTKSIIKYSDSIVKKNIEIESSIGNNNILKIPVEDVLYVNGKYEVSVMTSSSSANYYFLIIDVIGKVSSLSVTGNKILGGGVIDVVNCVHNPDTKSIDISLHCANDAGILSAIYDFSGLIIV